MPQNIKLLPKFERHLLAERTTGWWLRTEDLPELPAHYAWEELQALSKPQTNGV